MEATPKTRKRDPATYLPIYYEMFRESRDYGYKMGGGMARDLDFWRDLGNAIISKDWIPFCFMQKMVTSGNGDFVPVRHLVSPSIFMHFSNWISTCRGGGVVVTLSGKEEVPSLKVMSIMTEKERLRGLMARYPHIPVTSILKDPAVGMSPLMRVVSTPVEKWGLVQKEDWNSARKSLDKDPVLRAYINSIYGLSTISTRAEENGWEGLERPPGVPAHLSDTADWSFG